MPVRGTREFYFLLLMFSAFLSFSCFSSFYFFKLSCKHSSRHKHEVKEEEENTNSGLTVSSKAIWCLLNIDLIILETSDVKKLRSINTGATRNNTDFAASEFIYSNTGSSPARQQEERGKAVQLLSSTSCAVTEMLSSHWSCSYLTSTQCKGKVSRAGADTWSAIGV